MRLSAFTLANDLSVVLGLCVSATEPDKYHSLRVPIVEEPTGIDAERELRAVITKGQKRRDGIMTRVTRVT